MATSIVDKTQLKLQFDNGMVDGKQRYKSKTFSNIKNDASDDGLFAASSAINTLSGDSVLKTLRVVTTAIEE